MWKWKESFLSRQQDRKRGSILIAVLWSLFFLSTLAIAIYAYVSPQLGLAERLRDRVKTRYLAAAAMKRAILEVRNDETLEYDTLNELWSRNEEAFKDIALGNEGSFSLEYSEENDEGLEEIFYGLIDEERKININIVSSEVLKNLFEVVAELNSQDAGDIADSIIDWRDEDDDLNGNGAESGYYQTLLPAYSCKNKNFEALEELLLVKGMEQDTFDKVKDFITIFGNGAVNINTANMLTFQSLKMGLSLAEKIFQYRVGSDGVEGTEDDRIFSSVDGIVSSLDSSVGLSAEETEELNVALDASLLNIKSDYFMGNAYGRLNGSGKSGEVIFVVNRNEQVKYWRE